METRPGNWKARAIVVGALVGALTGAAAAVILVRRSEKHGESISVSSGEGLRLGLLLMGLLREVAALPARGES
jgi:ABC-type Mn2+/Zn2+ transport system permease subunit